MRTLGVLFLLIGLSGPAAASAVVDLQGRLLNRADSLPLAFAVVREPTSGIGTTADIDGRFDIRLEVETDSVLLEVTRVGCRTKHWVSMRNTTPIVLYIDCPALNIREVGIRGYTAEQMVREAVSRIPGNTAAFTYVTPGRARRCRTVNGKITALTESELMVLYNARDDSGKVSEAVAMAMLDDRQPVPEGEDHRTRDRYELLFAADPVLRLKENLLNPAAFPEYRFDFLDSGTGDTVRIRYVCESLENESHGIENYHEVELREEGWELGEITLLQSSFAVLSVKREAFRRAAYQYPGNYNFVLPQRKFTQEFDGAIFFAEYAWQDSLCYTARLAYRYANSFYHVMTHELAHTIVDSQEWVADKRSRNIDPNLADGFFFHEDDARSGRLKLNPAPLENLRPYYFEWENLYGK